MSRLKTGVLRTSRKENEYRVAIHPHHLERIPEQVRRGMLFERGYGEPFGRGDGELEGLGVGLAERAEILAGCELVLLPKPLAEDLRQLREGAVLWGWPHCVQQREVTQAAIDRRQTLIAFEAMFRWSSRGGRRMHILYKNNELAGYCSVLHALELVGGDGYYGRPRRAVVLGFGSVSRGAISALHGRGFREVDVYTLRQQHLVRDQVFGCRYGRMSRGPSDGPMRARTPAGERRPLAEVLAEADLIVNGSMQDPERPLMYLRDGEERRLRRGTVIVDVSCDEGMGFPFARPTSFESPAFEVGDRAVYYGVDHSPSYLWDAASWEISNALLPYLAGVMGGPEAWAAEPTLEKAIEIREGVVLNQKVLSFQGRAAEYPHEVE